MVHLLHRLHGVDAPACNSFHCLGHSKNDDDDFAIFAAPPIGEAEYCDERVCLCVCVFVCPRSYLRNYTSDLRRIFCACYLRGTVVERRSLAGELSLSCARPAADE